MFEKQGARLFAFTGTGRNLKYSLVLNDLLKAEELYLKSENKEGLEQVFINYANLYMRTRQYVKAIKFALQARDYSIQLKDTASLSIVDNTMGAIYVAQNMPDSAMKYYRESLKQLRIMNDRRQEALLMDNMSMLWRSINQNDSAYRYNSAALGIAKETRNAFLELQLLLNTAGVLENMHDYKTQVVVSERAVFLADSLQSFPYEVYATLNLGSAYINIKRYREGISLVQKSIPNLALFGDMEATSNTYYELSRAFEGLKQYDSSLYYHKKHVAASDSLDRIRDKDDVMDVLASKQMEVQEQKISYLNRLNRAAEEKATVLDEKNALKTAIIWISVCLLVVIVVLLYITFRRFRENKKLNVLLEHKNTEITDSINYAQKIQFALLPDEKTMGSLMQNAFILFMPKDIVSGDFYWVTQKDNLVFVAVGDCTGHGVPGGFMSMLGHSFLNEIIIDKHVHDPGKVLDLLRDKVIGALKQTGAAGENKDGMDMALVVIDKNNGSITYAAANNALYLVHKGELKELAPDKQPIGFYSEKMRPFTPIKIVYSPGDQLYLFTDGYADQFGGPRGKKLKYRLMKEHILMGEGLLPQQQKEQLTKTFMTWKGSFEQVDDVCIMGIKL